MSIMFTVLTFFLPFLTIGYSERHNCDRIATGKWQYLNEPYEVDINCSYRKKEVIAHFYPDKGFFPDDTIVLHFTGKVPKEFQSSEPIHVSICYKNYCGKRVELPAHDPIFKLVFIKKKE